MSLDAIGVALSASDLHVVYERFGRTDADHVDYESFCYLVGDCNRSLSLTLDNRNSRDSKYKPSLFMSASKLTLLFYHLLIYMSICFLIPNYEATPRHRMSEQYGQTFGQNQVESNNQRATDHVLGSGFDGLRNRYVPCLSVLTLQDIISEDRSKCHRVSMKFGLKAADDVM